jgi:hypothetical protein
MWHLLVPAIWGTVCLILTTQDFTVPGWTVTAENVIKLTADVKNKANNLSAFIFYILSNSSIRF